MKSRIWFSFWWKLFFGCFFLNPVCCTITSLQTHLVTVTLWQHENDQIPSFSCCQNIALPCVFAEIYYLLTYMFNCISTSVNGKANCCHLLLSLSPYPESRHHLKIEKAHYNLIGIQINLSQDFTWHDLALAKIIDPFSYF